MNILQTNEKQLKLKTRLKLINKFLLWFAVLILFALNIINNQANVQPKIVTQDVILQSEACFTFNRVYELLENNSFGNFKLASLTDDIKLQPEIIPVKEKINTLPKTVEKTEVKHSKTKQLSNELLGHVIYLTKGLSRTEWKNLSNFERNKYYDSYIIRFWNIAHEEYYKTGVHPLLILGRGARESQCATSSLYVQTNNMFCIKWIRSINNNGGFFGNKEYVVWSDDDPDDRFIKFNNTWEGIRGFCLFVNKDRYTKHLRWGKDRISENSLTQWSHALCKGGYSTTCEIDHDVDAGRRILNRAKELGLPMYLNDYNL